MYCGERSELDPGVEADLLSAFKAMWIKSTLDEPEVQQPLSKDPHGTGLVDVEE
jgi:hypothetical protein